MSERAFARIIPHLALALLLAGGLAAAPVGLGPDFGLETAVAEAKNDKGGGRGGGGKGGGGKDNGGGGSGKSAAKDEGAGPGKSGNAPGRNK